jgi:hypothetical protein
MLAELIPLGFHYGDISMYPLQCIDADIVDLTHITVRPFNDGSLVLPSYTTTKQPAICDACKWILATGGYHVGTCTYLGRNYCLCIYAGSRRIFTVQSVWYGTKNTGRPEFSDAEINKGITFSGQLI